MPVRHLGSPSAPWNKAIALAIDWYRGNRMWSCWFQLDVLIGGRGQATTSIQGGKECVSGCGTWRKFSLKNIQWKYWKQCLSGSQPLVPLVSGLHPSPLDSLSPCPRVLVMSCAQWILVQFGVFMRLFLLALEFCTLFLLLLTSYIRIVHLS